MKRLRTAVRAALSAIIITCAVQVAAAHDFYYPAVSGQPAGHMDGKILEYGEGMSSGALVIRSDDGRTVHYYLSSLPFKVNGIQIACLLPPTAPTYSRDPTYCPKWPRNLVLGRTRVRVFFWKGQRNGRPTLVAGGLRILQSH